MSAIKIPAIPSHAAGGRVGLLPLLTNYLSDLRKAASSLPIARDEALAAHASIVAIAKTVASAKSTFGKRAKDASGPLDAIIAARTDEKMRQIAPGPAIREERERIAATERRNAYRALLQQLAGEKAESVLKLTADAQTKLAVLSDRIERAAARDRLPLGLLGGISADALARITELREHFAACSPGEMRQTWADVQAAGAPDDVRMAAHVLWPMARTISTQGAAAFRKKKAALPNDGETDKQIGEARRLMAEISEWMKAQETGDTAAARAYHDALAWCWRRLCGLDAATMRRGDFERHAYQGDALGLTMRLASVEDILGRHVDLTAPMKVESR